MDNFYPIPNIEQLMIDYKGQIYNSQTKKILPVFYYKKRPFVSISINGKQMKVDVIKVFAETFITKPSSKHLAILLKENEISLTNVFWISRKDFQIKLFKERVDQLYRKHRLPDFDTSPNAGLYPTPIECEDMNGFYHIPFILDPYVINKDGCLYDLENKCLREKQVSVKGYIGYSVINKNYKRRTIPLHRILAMLFLKIPDRHKDISIDKLQVNHIDGVKDNNCLKNLEWVNGHENMNHARDNGLFSNQKEVIVRNYISGEIIKFRSISKAAEWSKIALQNLWKHLNSPLRGRILYNGYQFMFIDDGKWVEPYDIHIKNDKFRYTGHIFVKNIMTGKIDIFNNFSEACEYFGYVPHTVKNHRARNNMKTPYNNLIFLVEREALNGAFL